MHHHRPGSALHLPVLPSSRSRGIGPRGFAVRALALALACGLVACSSSTDSLPPDDPGGTASYNGQVDPSQHTFLLESVTTTPDGTPIRVDLLGSNLVVDVANEQVTLDVALRNADTRPLYPLIQLFVGELQPATVSPVGYDVQQCPTATATGGCWYGWSYGAELLGDDGVLAPGETSGVRSFAFHVPGLGSFAFAARVRAALSPDGARIAGMVFFDANENGHRDPGESGSAGGVINVRGPGIDSTQVQVGDGGQWSVPIRNAGMFTLTAIPPPSFREVHFTTPNPLQVLAVPRADGSPGSYLQADFGIANGSDPGLLPPVLFAANGDSLANDGYMLLQFFPEGVALNLRVAFSGCSPDHPLQLYMLGEFMESNPVQARVVLSHDGRGELCAAHWEKNVGYDLRPILRRYQQQYGTPGPVQIVFVDWEGHEHRFLLQP